MPDRFNVLISDFLEEAEVETPILADVADVTIARAHNEAQLREYLPRADAIFMFHDIPSLSDASFAIADRLRGVVRAGVGYNNVDLAAAGRRGIVVCNVPDYGTEEVADHAMMLLLALARRVFPCDQALREKIWDYRRAEDAPRLRGKVLGLVGCGRIGAATALRAKAFGLDVVFFDPYVADGFEKSLGIRRAFQLDELLPQCHFLSVHSYLSEETRHLIDARALSLLPTGSYLINTARGPIVDQIALVDALESGRLAGAGLDVFEREPLDDDTLRKHPNVILTPHSAFYSIEGFVELRSKTAREVRRLLIGEPPRNPVNREYLIDPRAKL